MRPSLTELLADSELPSYFKKIGSGGGIAAMTIQYAGTLALLTIQNNRLITNVGGPFPIPSTALVKDFSTLADVETLTPMPINLNLDLTQFATIEDLATKINSYNDYICDATADGADLSPLLLNEIINQNFAASPSGLVIEYAGATALVTISGGVLTTVVTDPTPFASIGEVKDFSTLADVETLTPEPIDLNLTLTDYSTLDALAAKINSYNDYSCSVTGAGSGLSPSLLLPVTNVNLANVPVDLFLSSVQPLSVQAMAAFSSLLLAIMSVYTSALQKSMANVDSGLQESCVATADGKWLDLWGSTLGTIFRNSGETDPVYRNRIIKEAQRIRLNANAIINAVKDELGLVVSIYNQQHNLAFVVGDPVQGIIGSGTFNRIVDRGRAQPIIYVGLPDPTPPQTHLPAPVVKAIEAIVERNRMAGIMPIYYTGGLPSF